MAVVQISKIQVRRGKKSQTNIPQLSGGELGWAVDTQQLYIGNGSVGEGAPFVGNTEVLTERSNIFNLLGAYSYQGYLIDNNGNSVIQTGTNPNTPLTRSLQQKLDETVSVRDFGAQGDYEAGIGTDDTLAIQRAIDQLFLNPSNKDSIRSRRTLYIPAGTYKLTSALYIPPNANIVGEGIDKTIFLQDVDTAHLIKTVALSSTPGTYRVMDSAPTAFNNNNAPTGVYIHGITFERKAGSQTNTTIAMLDCLSNSTFDSCKFKGAWTNGQGESAKESSAIQVRGTGTVSCENVLFLNCVFNNVAHGVYSDYDSNKINFKNCEFSRLHRGLTLAKGSISSPGQSFGPVGYVVESSLFDNIDAEGIKVFPTVSSRDHRSMNNKFLDVGNNNLGSSQPVTPVIDFSGINCDSIDDFFQRSADINLLDVNKGNLNPSMIAYLPDVLGADSVEYPTRSTTLFYNTQEANPKILVKAPAWSSTKIVIDYTIRKTSADLYRSGRLVINAHPDMADGIIAPTMTDTFTYHAQSESIGTTLGGNIRFIATVMNMSAVQISDVGGTLISSTTTKPTLVVRYINPAGPGGNAVINYTVTVMSGYKDF